MSKTQQTAGEKPRIGEQEVRRAAELLKKYRQGKVNCLLYTSPSPRD